MQPTTPEAVRQARTPVVQRGARPLPLEPPFDARSFDRFLDRCRRERIPFKLSLKQLARECSVAGDRLPDDLRYVKGFTWFFGFAFDRDNNDVVLLGLKDPSRPPIDIDCLVTALRAAYEGRFPACSLEKHPDPRYQASIVRGVPWGTRWAEIMIEADYDMKKINQGWIDPGISGLSSWYDMRLRWCKRHIEQGNTTWPGQANRWCFTRPKQDVKRTLTLLDNEVVLLYRNPVMLETEQEIGGKYGSGAIAPEAEEFARGFTRNLNLLGRKYRSIGELLALYRLQDLMVHLRLFSRGALPPESRFWLRLYRHPYQGPPKAMPTLERKWSFHVARSGSTYRYGFKVFGGVRMNLQVNPTSFKSEPAPADLRKRLLGGD